MKFLAALAMLSFTMTPVMFQAVRASPSTWTVSLDANSTSQIDTIIESSVTEQKSFRVGAVINATSSSPLTGVYGWELTVGYNPTFFIPQGDPDPLATAGNSLGLYPDGAVNTVLYGAQTTSGTVNWAALVSANEAFVSSKVNSTMGQITFFFVILNPNPAVTISATTLLANVDFEILNSTSSPQAFTVSNVIFVDANNRQISGVGPGTSVTETLTNAPPHASFTDARAPKIGPYAYTFNAKASSDSDDKIPNPGGYFWDFGDGTQDPGLIGSVVTHNYTAPGAFNVTLRVQDVPGETGASRDSLGKVIINSQPSHQYIDPSPGSPLGSMTAASANGCISLPYALRIVTSSSQFFQLNSTKIYKYESYGTGTDGDTCRLELFFMSASGDRIEAVVNPDGGIEKITPAPSIGNGTPVNSNAFVTNHTGPNWSGYEVSCRQEQSLEVFACNPPGQLGLDSSDTIEGAVMSFTLPSASSPTGEINGNSCCLMAEWVGIGNGQGAKDGPLIQAGIFKGTNNFASWNNVAWWEINYKEASLKSNNYIAWPCPGGPTDGDTMNVLVNETSISYVANLTTINFRYTDLNNGSLKCQLNLSVQVGGEWQVAYAYYIVEAPRVQGTCSFTGADYCQLPAWEDPISETAWLIDSCCQTQLIDQLQDATIYEDPLSQCSDTGPYNVAVYNPLLQSSWSSGWVTSAQSSTLSECQSGFTLDPSPNYLVVQPGVSVWSAIPVNSVGGYASTNNNLVFSTSTTPSSGVTVFCPDYTVISNADPSVTHCQFSSSTPGIYSVTITGTTTQPQGTPLSYSAGMTVVVPSIPITYTSPYSIDGYSVSLEGGLYNNAGTLTGAVVLSATDGTGAVRFYKTITGTFAPQFIVELSTSPYWLSVKCLIGSYASCVLSRTSDINHDGQTNIVDLAIIALCFLKTTQCPTPAIDNSLNQWCASSCALTADLTSFPGPPDGVVNVVDLVAEAYAFGFSWSNSIRPLYPP